MSMDGLAPHQPPIMGINDPQLRGRATQVLGCGGCVVLPTDTVYGVGALARDAEAVARLQNIKGRDDAFPPPVLVADTDEAWLLVTAPSAQARRLAGAFWPGPLTLVLPTSLTDLSLAARTGTVGVRVPDHESLRRLLRQTGPLAVSSANKHENPAATTVAEAVSQLGDEVSLYIDGGPTPGPAPSTVVDFTSGAMRVLRMGKLSEDEIRRTAGAADA